MINCGGLWQLGQAATSDYLSGFGSNISRQSLAKRPPAIASRSISRSSARISRPTCALCRASARFSFVNRPCVVCATAIRARPSSVRGPVDLAERHVSRQLRLAYLAPEVLKRLTCGRESSAVSLYDLCFLAGEAWGEQVGRTFD